MTGHFGSRAEALSLWSSLQAEYERYQEGVRYLPDELLRLQEDLRAHLAMRCAGFIEQVTFVVLTEYISQKSSGPIHSFSTSWFERTPNMNNDAFERLVGRFGDAHRAQYAKFMTLPRKEALGDLLRIRNDVAHGLEAKGRRLDPTRYMTLCEEIYEWLVATFLGASVEVLADDGTTVTGHDLVQS